MQFRLWTISLSILCATHAAYATVPKYGVSVNFPVITKDPKHLEAIQLGAWYQPTSLVWPHTRVYFDLNAGHWWVTNTSRHHSLNIVAIAPVLRYYFTINDYFSPYINLSIGLSYLSRTKLDDRNLGMHFAFQDRIGIGATLGKSQKLSVTLTALHYSNGSLCGWNAGITVPIMVGIDYGFG